MFIDETIPSNFNRVAELHDNYIVLVKEQNLSSSGSYEAYIQFFNPSTQIIHTTNYKITRGNTTTYNVHYVYSQYGSYIDYIDTSYTQNTYALDDITTDIWRSPRYTIYINYGRFIVSFNYCNYQFSD